MNIYVTTIVAQNQLMFMKVDHLIILMKIFIRTIDPQKPTLMPLIINCYNYLNLIRYIFLGTTFLTIK